MGQFEETLTIADDVLAQHHGAAPGQDRFQDRLARFQGLAAQIPAVAVEQVEGHERDRVLRLRAAEAVEPFLQRRERRTPVVVENDDLAVHEHRPLRERLAKVRELGEFRREVEAVS